MSVSKSFAVAPSNAIDLPWPIKILEPKIVKPVVDSILFEPAGFNVVTPADKGPTTFKLSLTSIWVESVERITLPEISIVPNVCVEPVVEMCVETALKCVCWNCTWNVCLKNNSCTP